MNVPGLQKILYTGEHCSPRMPKGASATYPGLRPLRVSSALLSHYLRGRGCLLPPDTPLNSYSLSQLWQPPLMQIKLQTQLFSPHKALQSASSSPFSSSLLSWAKSSAPSSTAPALLIKAHRKCHSWPSVHSLVCVFINFQAPGSSSQHPSLFS